jgi:hypothetical protein
MTYILWCIGVRVKVTIFYATFSNISAISWRLVSLVEETGVPGENYRPVASEWQTISHNVLSSTPRLIVFNIMCLVFHNIRVLSTCDRCLQSNYFINDELTTGHPWNSSRGCKLEMHIWLFRILWWTLLWVLLETYTIRQHYAIVTTDVFLYIYIN